MPFPDESFDAVLAISVLHHVDLKEAAVREVRRVLRARGLFSVSLTLAHCSACTTDDGEPLPQCGDTLPQCGACARAAGACLVCQKLPVCSSTLTGR
jgi:ubiquinone/menaquinone biosynthesis C-methylase UbiE